MRFFSRVVFICNVCFIIAATMRWVELGRRARGNTNGLIQFQPLEASLVILGYGAIFVNLVFFFLFLYKWLTKKARPVPRWIVLFNLLMFPIQIYYHFFFLN